MQKKITVFIFYKLSKEKNINSKEYFYFTELEGYL